MVPLLRGELFRLVRRPMSQFLLFILAASMVVLYLVLLATLKAPNNSNSTATIASLKDSLRVDSVPSNGLALVRSIGSILVVILSASAIASEFSWGTMRTILPRASSRGAFLAAKLAVLTAFAVVLVVLGYVVTLGASAAVTAIAGLNGNVGDDFAVRSLTSAARTVYVLLPYMALGFLAALWSRSSGAGIGVGLGVYFLESIATSLMTSAGGLLKRLAEALPAINATAVMQANRSGHEAYTAGLPDPLQAAGVLALYTLCFLVLAYWIFRNRDITVGAAG